MTSRRRCRSVWGPAPDRDESSGTLGWRKKTAADRRFRGSFQAHSLRCYLTMPKRSWEHFEHSADIGIRGTGSTLEEAFEEAAVALTAVVTDVESVSQEEAVSIECEAPNEELLFAEWINELVFQLSARRKLFSRFEVSIEGTRLIGKAWGEAVDVERHRPAVEVKGATYTELKAERDEGGIVTALCVVDVYREEKMEL